MTLVTYQNVDEDKIKLKSVPENCFLSGEISVPPDKSIAQRAAIFSAIAKDRSFIKNFPVSGDPQSTLKVAQQIGAVVEVESQSKEGYLNLSIEANGFDGLKEPSEVLDCGNSGTCLRFMMGVLAGNPFGAYAVLTGDQSLRKRPMKRIIDPLRSLGADIYGRDKNRLAPITVVGKKLKGGVIENKIASAQLKSALLLAGLNAEEPLIVKEPEVSRNHTEIMLATYGANISNLDDLTIKIEPSELKGCEIEIPGDISSAAFIVVAALLVPNSKVKINNVGLNKTRSGFLTVLQSMGAQIKVTPKNNNHNAEPIGDIEIEYSKLSGVEIGGKIIPNVIDELPILAIAAAQAEGTTTIKDAHELRVKESDRLKAMYELLIKLGVKVQEKEDGLIIEGNNGKPFSPKGEVFGSEHDHRIAMATGVAGLLVENEIELVGAEWANVSFPGFFKTIYGLITKN